MLLYYISLQYQICRRNILYLILQHDAEDLSEWSQLPRELCTSDHIGESVPFLPVLSVVYKTYKIFHFRKIYMCSINVTIRLFQTNNNFKYYLILRYQINRRFGRSEYGNNTGSDRNQDRKSCNTLPSNKIPKCINH